MFQVVNQTIFLFIFRTTNYLILTYLLYIKHFFLYKNHVVYVPVEVLVAQGGFHHVLLQPLALQLIAKPISEHIDLIILVPGTLVVIRYLPSEVPDVVGQDGVEPVEGALDPCFEQLALEVEDYESSLICEGEPLLNEVEAADVLAGPSAVFLNLIVQLLARINQAVPGIARAFLLSYHVPDRLLHPQIWLFVHVRDVLVELPLVKPLLKALVAFPNSLEFPVAEFVLNGVDYVDVHVALIEFWADGVRQCRIEQQREYQSRCNSDHHERSEFEQIDELALEQNHTGGEGSYRAIQQSDTDLLEARFNSVPSFVIHAFNVLVAHVDHVVDGEADEDDQGQGFGNANAPPTQINRGHNGAYNEYYRDDREKADGVILVVMTSTRKAKMIEHAMP